MTIISNCDILFTLKRVYLSIFFNWRSYYVSCSYSLHCIGYPKTFAKILLCTCIHSNVKNIWNLHLRYLFTISSYVRVWTGFRNSWWISKDPKRAYRKQDDYNWLSKFKQLAQKIWCLFNSRHYNWAIIGYQSYVYP